MLHRKSEGTRRPSDDSHTDGKEQGECDTEQESFKDALSDTCPPNIVNTLPAKNGHEVRRADGTINGICGSPNEAASENPADGGCSDHQRTRFSAELRHS